MKHIKKFESFNNTEEVSKVNEEFDFASVSELLNNFSQWCQHGHLMDDGSVVTNGEIATGISIVGLIPTVLGAIGLGKWYSNLKAKRKSESELNELIIKKVKENPNKDPKDIAQEVVDEIG